VLLLLGVCGGTAFAVGGIDPASAVMCGLGSGDSRLTLRLG